MAPSLEKRRFLTLIACVMGSSLAFIDATVVIVALPTIRADLDMSLAGQEWVFLSYSLALAALYLPAGAVGDRWGRRETFMAGTAGFAVASALAAFAPNSAMLIGARFLQGVAGAFVTTNSLALIREVYGKESGRAVGLWTSLTGVATIAGPPVGGLLVEWNWRSIFFINLPLAAVTVALALAGRCPKRAQHRVGALDVPGALLAAIGFGALTYGVVEGAERGFAELWWAFVLAGAALAAFLVVERRVPEPMLPLDLFRRRNFAAANLETFFVYAGLSGVLLYWTLYLQFLGFTPFEAGLLNTPTSLIMILLAARFGMYSDRFGPRLFLTVGPVLIGVAMLLFLPMDEKSDFWTWGIAGLVLFGFGLCFVVAPITATALSSAPGRYAGIASGVNSTVSRVGGLLAVAVIGLVVTLVFEASAGATDAVPLASGQDDPDLRDASIEAFRWGMIVAAALSFTGAAVAALGISNDEARRARELEHAPAAAAET
jgi:EmrB/QacA subfamily drug resistance transporter